MIGSGACTTCDSDSTSLPGSDSNDDCTCNTAYNRTTRSITNINKITTFRDKYLYKIIFHTTDGDVIYGGVGGTPEILTINAGENIVKVFYKTFIRTTFGPYIGCGIIFLTSQGRTLDFSGTYYNNRDVNNNVINDCGSEQTFEASAWKPVTGLTQVSAAVTSDFTGVKTEAGTFCAPCTLAGFVDDCTCAAGMTKDSTTNACVSCGAGKYKATTVSLWIQRTYHIMHTRIRTVRS
jgi:hypothetical protein